MPNGHDILAIGASSGGVEALTRIVSGLPEDLPAAVFVVLHLSEEAPSVLSRILDRAGPLEAVSAEDGGEVEKGRIYVARPGRHLLVERGRGQGRVRVTRGPKENRHRPAVDPLFRTAALAYGPRVVGVVLTGARNDGTAGLLAVKRRGGIAVVQDPEDALFPGMPQSALQYVPEVDHCVPLGKMAPLLERLAYEEVPAEKEGAYETVPGDMHYEAQMAGLDSAAALRRDRKIGETSEYTCPECTGPLFEIHDGQLLRFRCRVGHAYTADSLLDEKDENLENALYIALNTLEEGARMSQNLASKAREHRNDHAARRFEERAKDMEEKAAAVRRVLTNEGQDLAEVRTDGR